MNDEHIENIVNKALKSWFACLHRNELRVINEKLDSILTSRTEERTTHPIKPMSNYDKQNIGLLLKGEGTWFTAHLVRLIANADEHNLNKLRSAYPDEVAAVETYRKEKA